MSLIFKALKKQKTAATAPSDSSEELMRRSTNVYSFQRIIFSPLVILLLFITGLVLYYGALYLYSLAGRNTPVPAARSIQGPSRATQTGSVVSVQEDMSHNLEIPERPDDLPPVAIQEPTPKSLTFRQSPIEAPASSEGTPVEFLGKSSLPAAPSSPESTLSLEQKDRSPADLGQVMGRHQAFGPKIQTNTVSREIPRPQASLNATVSKAKKRLQERIQKNRRVRKLILSLQSSLAQQKYNQADQMIRQLESLVPNNHPYLLKIKAYYLICTKQYEPAAQLLQQVLMDKKEDIEANINLAIIEIKTGQLDTARDRLAALSRQNPENTTIQRLIDKLKQ